MELAHKGTTIPIASFAAAVGLSESEPVNELLILTTRFGQFGLTVPSVLGRRQVAVKGIGPLLGGVPHLTGAALLGGGRVVVIVEPNRIGDNVRTIPAPVSGRPRVLVVDDSRGVRQLVAAALSSNGFEVTVAGNAETALVRLEAESFDALVVDYMMPGSVGVELVTRVRERQGQMKIVMVSGVAAEEDKDRAWSAGVNAYLDKFDLRQGALAATLRSLLGMAEEKYRSTGLAM
jgi:CheY-like chemotaxis protein